MKKLLIGAMCVMATAANAEFWDGNKLLAHMTGTTAEQIMAIGYVGGVADAIAGSVYCAPSNVTLGQVNDMTKRALELAPSERHQSADAFVKAVTSLKWPCKKGVGHGV